MIHDIPAKSRLVPTIPITSPRFVYRRAGDTDVRATFARARAGLEGADRGPGDEAPRGLRRGANEQRPAQNDELSSGMRLVR